LPDGELDLVQVAADPERQVGGAAGVLCRYGRGRPRVDPLTRVPVRELPAEAP
jgi:hypothetical protein